MPISDGFRHPKNAARRAFGGLVVGPNKAWTQSLYAKANRGGRLRWASSLAELEILESVYSAWARCKEEQLARLVVLEGHAGIGKSGSSRNSSLSSRGSNHSLLTGRRGSRATTRRRLPVVRPSFRREPSTGSPGRCSPMHGLVSPAAATSAPESPSGPCLERSRRRPSHTSRSSHRLAVASGW